LYHLRTDGSLRPNFLAMISMIFVELDSLTGTKISLKKFIKTSGMCTEKEKFLKYIIAAAAGSFIMLSRGEQHTNEVISSIVMYPIIRVSQNMSIQNPKSPKYQQYT
jgi:hypothetical protein